MGRTKGLEGTNEIHFVILFVYTGASGYLCLLSPQTKPPGERTVTGSLTLKNPAFTRIREALKKPLYASIESQVSPV